MEQPHHLPGGQGDHTSQVKPASMGSDVHDVGHSERAGLERREPTLKVIEHDHCWLANSHAWLASISICTGCAG